MLMSRVMSLSGAESLAAAANIFVGQTEAPLIVKPYISRMTRSEILALMVGGMATIAGSVFAIYMGMLGGTDESSRILFGKFLLCASAMNAPAALLFAKILIPETNEVDHQLTINREEIGRNPIDALANGTTQGLSLALNVAAMLISFYALILLLITFLPWITFFWRWDINQWLSMTTNGRFEELSLQAIFGFLFAPIAWYWYFVGRNPRGRSIDGTKLFATEFFAFADLATLQSEGLSTRSVYLATFALRFCQFYVNWHSNWWDWSSSTRAQIRTGQPWHQSSSWWNFG